VIPILGALCCAYLVGPWTGRDLGQYTIAGLPAGHRRSALADHLLHQPAMWGRQTYIHDPEALEGVETKP
jgi:hypothetical protein